jgi:hypothetical protein
MKKKLRLISFFLFFSVSLFNNTNAQDGCFGIGSFFKQIINSGLYAGYGFQEFSAEGFNNYIRDFNQNPDKNFSTPMDEFGYAKGFGFGLNLLQFLTGDLVFGMKASYHILKEKHESVQTIPEGLRNEFNLTLKSFQIGFSFAYYVSKHLDLKITELTLTFNSADLEITKSGTNLPDNKQEYTSVDNPIGVSVASGLTLYIIPPYISVEGTAGYSFFYIDDMRNEDTGRRLPVYENTNSVMTNFIDGGGIFAFAQLNIAIPFN